MAVSSGCRDAAAAAAAGAAAPGRRNDPGPTDTAAFAGLSHGDCHRMAAENGDLKARQAEAADHPELKVGAGGVTSRRAYAIRKSFQELLWPGNVKALNLKKFKIIAEPVAAMAGGGPAAGGRWQENSLGRA